VTALDARDRRLPDSDRIGESTPGEARAQAMALQLGA
jgi:hypothetical protein